MSVLNTQQRNLPVGALDGHLGGLGEGRELEAWLNARFSMTQAPTTIYVDPVAGDDLLNTGLSVSSPVQTLAKAISLLPEVVMHNCCIVCAAGSYSEFGTVRLSKYIGDGVTLLISGSASYTIVDDNAGAKYTAAAGSGTGLLVLGAAPWVADAHMGYFARMLTGDTAGQVRSLQGNGTDRCTPHAPFTADPTGDTFEIVEPSTVLTSSVGTSVLSLHCMGPGTVKLQRLKVAGTKCSIASESGNAKVELSHIVMTATSTNPIYVSKPVLRELSVGLYTMSETTFVDGTTSIAGLSQLGATGTVLIDMPGDVTLRASVLKLATLRNCRPVFSHGSRVKGALTLAAVKSPGSDMLLDTATYAGTKIDTATGVGLTVREGSYVSIKDIDISSCGSHGLEVIDSFVEMTGIVTGTTNTGAGCKLTSGGKVKITHGSTPTLTGTVGEISLNGTAERAKWAWLDAATPGHQKMRHEVFTLPVAGGTAVLAQQNTDFDVAVGFTQPDVPRNLQITFSADWDGGNIEVTGICADGRTRTEVFVDAVGAVVGAQPFLTITRIRNLGTRTLGTVDPQLAAAANTVFGVCERGQIDFLQLRAGAAVEAIAAESTANGTFQPTTVPDALTTYDIWYLNQENPFFAAE